MKGFYLLLVHRNHLYHHYEDYEINDDINRNGNISSIDDDDNDGGGDNDADNNNDDSDYDHDVSLHLSK